MEPTLLHILESILSQEDLPDFYEENREQISQACICILETNLPQVQDAKDFECETRPQCLHEVSESHGSMRDSLDNQFKEVTEFSANFPPREKTLSEKLDQMQGFLDVVAHPQPTRSLLGDDAIVSDQTISPNSINATS